VIDRNCAMLICIKAAAPQPEKVLVGDVEWSGGHLMNLGFRRKPTLEAAGEYF